MWNVAYWLDLDFYISTSNSTYTHAHSLSLCISDAFSEFSQTEEPTLDTKHSTPSGSAAYYYCNYARTIRSRPLCDVTVGADVSNGSGLGVTLDDPCSTLGKPWKPRHSVTRDEGEQQVTRAEENTRLSYRPLHSELGGSRTPGHVSRARPKRPHGPQSCSGNTSWPRRMPPPDAPEARQNCRALGKLEAASAQAYAATLGRARFVPGNPLCKSGARVGISSSAPLLGSRRALFGELASVLFAGIGHRVPNPAPAPVRPFATGKPRAAQRERITHNHSLKKAIGQTPTCVSTRRQPRSIEFTRSSSYS